MPESIVAIVPAVLVKSLKEITELLTPLQGVVNAVQVDIVDGEFARAQTWPYKDHKTFEKILSGESTLPFWENFEYEFDLMVAQPVNAVPDFIRTGIQRIVLHAKSEDVLSAFQHLVDMRDDRGVFRVEVGVAIMPTDQPSILEQFDAQFDFVQVMGIDTVGKQGQKFNHHALYLVERLHRLYPQLQLQVDGGVSIENAQALVHAGASRLIVGSAIFGVKDPVAAYRELVSAVNTA